MMYNTTKPYTSQILNLIKQTWETPYVSVKNGIINEKFSYAKCFHVDGIGTKGIYHWEKRSFKNAVIDALAMNLNDMAFLRAIPYAITDHIFLPKDDSNAILEIAQNLTEECKKRNIAIVGGETAIHNNKGGLEISISVLGFLEKPKINKFKLNDVLIGINSSGLHSNGFTKIREIFKNEYLDDFIKPTAIYLETILKLNEKIDIHGMMHITGGAFTKLKLLLDDCDAVIEKNHKLDPQEIFYKIYKKKIPDKEMYKTFNCGIGFILGVSEKDVDIYQEIKDFKADIIGKVVPGDGNVKIKSKFSDKEIVL